MQENIERTIPIKKKNPNVDKKKKEKMPERTNR